MALSIGSVGTVPAALASVHRDAVAVSVLKKSLDIQEQTAPAVAAGTATTVRRGLGTTCRSAGQHSQRIRLTLSTSQFLTPQSTKRGTEEQFFRFRVFPYRAAAQRRRSSFSSTAATRAACKRSGMSALLLQLRAIAPASIDFAASSACRRDR